MFTLSYQFMSESIEETIRKSQQLTLKYQQFQKQQQKFRIESQNTSKSLQQTIQKIGTTLTQINQTQTNIANFQKAFDEAINKLAGQAAQSFGGNSSLDAVKGTPQQAAEMVKKAKRVFILTGAGMSAGSGIRTFRDTGGYWKQKEEQGEDPKKILTLDYFNEHPARCWGWLLDFYKVKAKAKPNPGHWSLERIISYCLKNGKQVTLVTQNIDNLHTQAHQQSLLETQMSKLSTSKKPLPATAPQPNFTYYQIHGNITKLRCQPCTQSSNCLKTTPTNFSSYLTCQTPYTPPNCPQCNSQLRPHIMFFDEAYSQAINGYDSVLDELSKSDLVIVIGTMLQTGLANGIVSRSVSAQTQIIEINMNQEILKGKTMTLLGKAEEVVPQIANIIGPRSQCEKCSKSKSPGRRKKSPEKPTKGMKAPEPPSKGKASKK